MMVQATMYRVVILQPGEFLACKVLSIHVAASIPAWYKNAGQFVNPILLLRFKRECNLCCHVRWKCQTWRHSLHYWVSCVLLRLSQYSFVYGHASGQWMHVLHAVRLAYVAGRIKWQQPVTACHDAEGCIHSKHAACKQREGSNDTSLYLICVIDVVMNSPNQF